MSTRVKSIVFLLIFLALASPAYGVEIFPLSEVKPGMTGVGYTVIQGSEIESFPVEIVGVLPRSGARGDRIVIRAYGDVIDRAGGVAQGMSGSPVYIDDKLVGAIGYGWEFTDHRTAMLTTAEDLVQLLDLVSKTPVLSPPVKGDDGDDFATPIDDPAASLMTPISVSGFGQRSLRLLEKVFGPLGMSVVPGGTSGASSMSQSLTASGEAPYRDGERSVEPGSAVAALLARGDVSIGVVGTLTEIRGDHFVAFAHPWFHRGRVSYFLNDYSVLMTMPSIASPFKIGTIQGPLGAVLQDRSAGIAGVLGYNPPSVSLDVSVKDLDRDVLDQLTVEVVRDDALSATLLAISALEGLDRGLDRLGPGTANLRFTIEGENLPRQVVRENLFYSASDIAGLALSELYDALLRISANAYDTPAFTKVTVEAEIKEQRRTAQIEEARPVRRRVAPGGEVEVMVRLVPFREAPEEIVVPVTIPQDVAPGPLTLTVRGGDQGIFSPVSVEFEEYLGEAVDMEWDDTEKIRNEEGLLRLIEEIESAPKSNDIVIEFYPVLTEDRNHAPENSSTESDGSDESMSLFLPVRTVYPSDYVVRGIHSIEVLVTPPREARQDDEVDAAQLDGGESDADEMDDETSSETGEEETGDDAVGEEDETNDSVDDPVMAEADHESHDESDDESVDGQTVPSPGSHEKIPPAASIFF